MLTHKEALKDLQSYSEEIERLRAENNALKELCENRAAWIKDRQAEIARLRAALQRIAMAQDANPIATARAALANEQDK